MMGDKLIMSQKELDRKVILEAVRQGQMTLQEASDRLEISYRQVKRIWKEYKLKGNAGLVHKLRGKPSTQAYDEAYRKVILQRYEERYIDFGPTFAHEKLTEEDNYSLSVETLRKWLLEAGLWLPKRRRKKHRQRRARKEQFGELLQIDGSIHDWFCNGKNDCLLNIVDDATGMTLSQLDTGETTFVLLKTLWLWILLYGIPNSIYVDLKNLYISPKRLKKEDAEDDKEFKEGLSVFQRVCKKLHIKIIKAYSPQAKGRVERNHGVYQDRFVKELRLKQINTIEEANKFLLEKYIDKVNSKFSKEPLSKVDGHRSIEGYGDLKEIFCWEYTRQVQNDWVIRIKGEYYQILKEQEIEPKAKQSVTIRIYLDGTLGFWFKNTRLKVEKIAKPQKSEKVVKKRCINSAERSAISRKNKGKTPWSQFNSLGLNSGEKVKPVIA